MLAKELLKSVLPQASYNQIKSLYRRTRFKLEVLAGADASMIPPPEMNFVGDGDFVGVGKHFVEMLKRLADLKPSDRVLDIGSGIGRIAIPLTEFISSKGSYDGLEIVEQGIAWCDTRITTKYPQFRFTHADVFNSFYNPDGQYKAEDYRFPYPDQSFDLVFLTSVFTHMLPAEVEHYLQEIYRVLKPGGRCFASFFILNKTSRSLIDSNKSTFKFAFGDDVFRVNDLTHKEAAVAFDEAYLRAMFDRAKLKIKGDVYFGRWSGLADGYDFQDFVISTKT
jgi:ubiquinone/menaquinone biosynthesis C-methylase UbiE